MPSLSGTETHTEMSILVASISAPFLDGGYNYPLAKKNHYCSMTNMPFYMGDQYFKGPKGL